MEWIERCLSNNHLCQWLSHFYFFKTVSLVITGQNICYGDDVDRDPRSPNRCENNLNISPWATKSPSGNNEPMRLTVSKRHSFLVDFIWKRCRTKTNDTDDTSMCRVSKNHRRPCACRVPAVKWFSCTSCGQWSFTLKQLELPTVSHSP